MRWNRPYRHERLLIKSHITSSSDQCSPLLDRPASTIYRHELTGALESAIRSSNAQFENVDILRRLDVQILEVNISLCICSSARCPKCYANEPST